MSFLLGLNIFLAIFIFSTALCPADWLIDPKFPNICYTNGINDTWNNALLYCQGLGATLPIFQYNEEYFSYVNLIRPLGIPNCANWTLVSQVWIGIIFNETASNSTPVWSDRSPVTFSYWLTKYSQATNCTLDSMYGFQWQSRSCSSAFPSYCQHKISASSLTPSPSFCPTNWTVDESGICYYYPDYSTDWKNASNYCNALNSNASLPQFCSLSEFANYMTILSKFTKCTWATWLGFADFIGDKSFSWIDGGCLTMSTWWMFYPTGGPGFTSCGSTCTGWQNVSCWKSLTCTSTIKFVCQIRMNANNSCFEKKNALFENKTCNIKTTKLQGETSKLTISLLTSVTTKLTTTTTSKEVTTTPTISSTVSSISVSYSSTALLTVSTSLQSTKSVLGSSSSAAEALSLSSSPLASLSTSVMHTSATELTSTSFSLPTSTTLVTYKNTKELTSRSSPLSVSNTSMIYANTTELASVSSPLPLSSTLVSINTTEASSSFPSSTTLVTYINSTELRSVSLPLSSSSSASMTFTNTTELTSVSLPLSSSSTLVMYTKATELTSPSPTLSLSTTLATKTNTKVSTTKITSKIISIKTTMANFNSKLTAGISKHSGPGFTNNAALQPMIDIACFVGAWSQFSPCTQLCGISVTKFRQRTVGKSNASLACPNATEFANCGLPPCNPMTPTAQDVAKILQTLGCSWLILICSIAVTITVLLRSFTINQIVHMSEEIALILAHVLIALFRSKTENFVFCTVVSIFIQYFFIVLFVFIVLEAFEMYALITTVVNGNGWFNRCSLLSIGWGLPFPIVVITALVKYVQYSSTFSCWLNFTHPVAFGTFVPITVCCCLSVILLEAAGQRDTGNSANFQNQIHITSAKINQRSLLVLIPLHFAAWFVGQSAVFYQNIGLFSTVFALNISLGCAVFFFHIISNEKVLEPEGSFGSLIICGYRVFDKNVTF